MVERQPVVLMQFAKAPEPGTVKTRMHPHLTLHQCAQLHTELLLWTSNTLLDANLGPVQLWVSGDVDHTAFRDARRAGCSEPISQQGGDLGERMYHALTEGLARYQKVILVGSDCPAIDRDYLVAALAALDATQLVVGPAADGGYVLLGATTICAELFTGVSWGESSVYAQTVRRIEQAQLTWSVLPTLPDIDRPADLPGWLTLRERRRLTDKH